MTKEIEIGVERPFQQLDSRYQQENLQREYHIIPLGDKYGELSSNYRIGLVSFSYGKALNDKLNEVEVEGRAGWKLYSFPCEKLTHDYLRFYMKTLKDILQLKKADFYFANEYAFPSFEEHPCRRRMKHSHNDIINYLSKYIDKNKAVLFTGTGSVLDDSVGEENYGYSQGYLLSPASSYIPVSKFTFAKQFDKVAEGHIAIENFKRTKYPTLNIFRTPFGNIAFSICADFLSKQNIEFFGDRLHPNPTQKKAGLEISLLVVPARDGSGSVVGLAKDLSNKVNYGIAWVNAGDVKRDSEDENGIYFGGELMNSMEKIPFPSESREYSACLRIFEFSFIEATINRFKKYKKDQSVDGVIFGKPER